MLQSTIEEPKISIDSVVEEVPKAVVPRLQPAWLSSLQSIGKPSDRTSNSKR